MANTVGFDPVLGRVPSGIFILTVGSGDQATGMLASWVMQAGFEPAMVSVAIKQGRYVNDWITAGQPFVLNLVGEDSGHFLKHFGRGFEPGEAAFFPVAAVGHHDIGHLFDNAGAVWAGDSDHQRRFHASAFRSWIPSQC